MSSTTKHSLRPLAVIFSCIVVLALAVPAFASRDFTVKTDRSSYSTGSTVTIKVKNTGTESIHLATMGAMVQVGETGGWREVYTWPTKPGGLPSDVAAGDVVSWTWNTKDNEGSAQPAGTYRVKVHITMPQKGWEAEKYSGSFTLTSGWSAKKEITVTSNMAQYHVGGIVNFTIKNTGDVPVDTGSFSWIVYRHTATGPEARSTHNSRPGGIPNPLPVGASKSWSWDMRNDSGGYVAADDYELEVKLPNVPDGGIEGNCFFKVIP